MNFDKNFNEKKFLKSRITPPRSPRRSFVPYEVNKSTVRRSSKPKCGLCETTPYLINRGFK